VLVLRLLAVAGVDVLVSGQAARLVLGVMGERAAHHLSQGLLRHTQAEAEVGLPPMAVEALVEAALVARLAALEQLIRAEAEAEVPPLLRGAMAVQELLS
jgi:hypothetical protein